MPEARRRDPVGELLAAVESAASAVADGGGPQTKPTLERPPQPDHGDYSTNGAMLLAPALGRPPREIAGELAERLESELGGSVERVEVAGPGFVNVFLSDRWHREATAAILGSGAAYGGGEGRGAERILLEFVSANPTGPITVAAARHAAYGDSLARLLELAGYELEREYLLNDVGGQVDRFAASIAARMRGEEPPEDGYAGEYVAEIARELAAAGIGPDELEELGRRGAEAMRQRIEASLERFGVRYDTWFSERSLHEAGAIDAAVAALREGGHVYESEGATWLRTTSFGDDKDRVLLRANGQPTYFAADIAYHRNKLERGAERLIDPLGADHHGYTTRVRAALVALGLEGDRYETPMLQLVNIVERGERAQVSKRKGQFVTLDELLDDIGVDAARFFMLQRSHETAIDLDLDLAREQTQDNPVYYVQYAHARIASILRKAVADGATPAGPGDGPDEDAIAGAASSQASMAAPAETAERALAQRLLEFPAETALAAERRAPHRLCAYATATAADFHAFYRDCQVVGAVEGREPARLGLCLAARRVIARTLGLLGVGAPARM